ncbi:hypothetical protein D3C78_563820 [compost metagenome]
MPGGVGGKHIIGLAEFLWQQRGQVQRPVESLAIELPKAFAGLFGVAQEHQGLYTVHRFGAAFHRLDGQQADSGKQGKGQRSVTVTLEQGRQLHRALHSKKG